jgi:hypothetical protein
MLSSAVLATYKCAPSGVIARPDGCVPVGVAAPSEVSDPSNATAYLETLADPELTTNRNLPSGEMAMPEGDVPVASDVPAAEREPSAPTAYVPTVAVPENVA